MESTKKKRKALVDHKNPLVYAFWSMVNVIVLRWRFKKLEISGQENLPKKGAFLMVCNHSSRWDGLIAYRTVNRPANFMVSPNELRGYQGSVLMSMGSFPADPRFDLIGHAVNLFKRGQGIVVFPEGNTFYDGSTHKFKTGAAKIAFAARNEGIDLPVLPAAIHYPEDGTSARIVIGKAISLDEYANTSECGHDAKINSTEDKITYAKVAHDSCDSTAQVESNPKLMRSLADRMFREVCFLRASLGSTGDNLALFTGANNRNWVSMTGEFAQDQKALQLHTAMAEGMVSETAAAVLCQSSESELLKVS